MSTSSSTSSHASLNATKPSTSLSTKASLSSLSTTSSTSTIFQKGVSTPKPSKAKKVWAVIKKHAKEHHESVNAAYSTYYGQGYNTKAGPVAP